MKTYSLGAPPAVPGLYILTNSKTGQLYIGQSVNLRRRYGEWRSVFVTGLGSKNPGIHKIASANCDEDWTFGVLMEMPGATNDDLDRCERRAIQRVHAQRPAAILNGLRPEASKPRSGGPIEGQVAKSIVRDRDGSPMTYGQVAARLGIHKKSLQKRLRQWRVKGRGDEVNFTELEMMSHKYKTQDR